MMFVSFVIYLLIFFLLIKKDFSRTYSTMACKIHDNYWQQKQSNASVTIDVVNEHLSGRNILVLFDDIHACVISLSMI
jgi:hypothetical protein